MKSETQVDVTSVENQIPVVKIVDPYAYVSGDTIIAYLSIESPRGEQKRPFVRTRKDGYMTR